MTIRASRIERYYDNHESGEIDLTQGRLHFAAVQYLLAVLNWLFHGQKVGITYDVNFYQTADLMEAPLSPDIAVVDGLEIEGAEAEQNPSYWVGEDGPAPRVVIEISSKKTWADDLKLEEKRGKYFAMSIGEYFVFDPQQRTVWTKEWRRYNRLIGWRRKADGEYEELEKDEAGRLWSEQLQSWLVVEGQYLRLYTQNGELRLTEAEAVRVRAAKLAERLRQLGENPDEIF